MAVEGIAKTVWAQKFVNFVKNKMVVVEAQRDEIVDMRAVFAGKGIDVTGTKLEGKVAGLTTLIDNLSAVVNSAEVTWLKNNANQTTRTTELE